MRRGIDIVEDILEHAKYPKSSDNGLPEISETQNTPRHISYGHLMTIYIVLHTICFSCVSFARISFIPIYSQRSQFLCTTEGRKHGVCSIKRLHDFPLPLLNLPALDLCPSWALLLLLRPSVIA